MLLESLKVSIAFSPRTRDFSLSHSFTIVTHHQRTATFLVLNKRNPDVLGRPPERREERRHFVFWQNMAEYVTQSLVMKKMVHCSLGHLHRWICAMWPNARAQQSGCHLTPLWILCLLLRSIFLQHFAKLMCYLPCCFSFVISQLSVDSGRNIHLSDKQG